MGIMLKAKSNLTSSLSCLKHFTLIELLVVIAIIAIQLRSKWLFFLLFSAGFAFSHFDEKTLNSQMLNVAFRIIPRFGIIF